MNQQPNYFNIITGDVMYDKNLNPNAKLIFGLISSLTNKEGFCWATNAYFAELYGKSIVTVSRWISQLADAGYIKVFIDKANGNKRMITIDKNVNTLLSKTTIPIIKNDNSYIRNNNISNNISEYTRASDFLKHNYPIAFETWELKHKNQVKNYEKLLQDFNDTVDIEGLQFIDKILFARLNKYFRNWVQIENRPLRVVKDESNLDRPEFKRIG